MWGRIALAILCAVPLAGCVKDRAVRPMSALHPAAPSWSHPFADELDAFATMRDVYVAHGWPEAGSVQLTLTSQALIPYLDDDTVYAPPFMGGEIDEHLSLVSRAVYAGRLDGYAAGFANPASAQLAYEVFMTTALAHELAHAVAHQRGTSTVLGDSYHEEMRAIDLERSVLGHLVEIGRLPADWLDWYASFNRALLAAAPEGLAEAMPGDHDGRRAEFNPHYPHLLSGVGEALEVGVHPHQDGVDRVLLIYTLRRLNAKVWPLAEQADSFDPPPPEEAP